MEQDAVVVLVTANSEEQARTIAHDLLAKKLIACANLVPVNSLFMWDGQLQDEREVLMIIKTQSSVFKDKVIEAVKALHSYDVPEVIAMPIVLGSAEYLRWIASEVNP